jgi:hypothetical protein
VKYPGNPILLPAKPWEGRRLHLYGTVLRDPKDGLFKMWYHSSGGPDDTWYLMYAVSADGYSWDRPEMDHLLWNGQRHDVEITDPNCSGVIFAHGSRFGGHSLFIKDKKLTYVYNFLGIPPEQSFVGPELKPGKYTLGMEFTREKAGQYHESMGTTKLYVNDKVVAEGPMRAQVGKFTLSGDGLCVGRDSGDAVSHQYKSPGTFTGGTIYRVGVTVEKAQYLDLEKMAAAAFAVD